MNGSTWLVVLGGAAAIAWVNWYFFLAGRSRPVVAIAAQDQVVTVNGGYSPALLKVKAGTPVRLVFDRKDSGACTDEVVFPDFGIRRFLPTGKQTTIEFTAPKAGRYEFACGMSMHHGAIVAED